ncbi:MAG: glycosyltransferase family 4 protein [Candidatus Aminicenantes bacterium]|nr:glycosyltransferase family 4 protein [Candidatus Aminicenantes bacterium]
MKILLINKFFFSFGGTETAFFQTAKLLQEQGHEVIFFSMAHPKNRDSRQSSHFVSRVDFEEMRGWREFVRGAKRILFGCESRARLEELLRVEKPDIAHLHNIYHHLSPTIIGTLKKHGVPVVLTIHDYKVVCPAYKLFVRGAVCETCRSRRFYWCVLKKCIQGSRLKSLLCAVEVACHRRYYEMIDALVSPSRFLMAKMAAMGFPTKRFRYIPNAVSLEGGPPQGAADPPQVLCFGRLVEEKGIHLLIEAMKGVPAECLIVGDGPQKKKLQDQAAGSPDARIRFLGHQPFPVLEPIIRRATMVVIPSIWYENNPFSVIESFSMGIPVVAARIGGLPELVIDRETGMLFTAGSSAELHDKIMLLLKNPDLGRELARKARLHLEQNFHPDVHIEKLLHLYQELIEANAKS